DKRQRIHPTTLIRGQIQEGVMHLLIHEHQMAITELCRRYRVRRLEVFGSAARGVDFAPGTSDADFLVEFAPSSDGPSLKDLFDFQNDLAQLLGCAVDLAEASALRNPYVQAGIDQKREVVYAA
ncbi:MAG: nucleotidyltransferase family protein, partial [Methylococcales bacterium]